MVILSFWLQKIPKTSISRPPGWPHASKRSPTSHEGHFGGTAAGELPCVATKTRFFLVFFFLRLKSRLFFKQFRVYLEGNFGMFFQMFKTQKLFKKRGVHLTKVDSNCVFFFETPAGPDSFQSSNRFLRRPGSRSHPSARHVTSRYQTGQFGDATPLGRISQVQREITSSFHMF